MAKTPHKYRPHFASEAYDLSLLGYTDEELALHFGVSRQSIANWKVQHPEFCKALLAGKELADAAVAGSLYKRSTGMTIEEQHVVKMTADDGSSRFEIVTTEKQIPPDPKAAIHWLHNRQPHRWSRKVDVRIVQIQKEMEAPDKEEVIAAMDWLMKQL